MKIVITGIAAEGKTTASIIIAEALMRAGFVVRNTDEDVKSGQFDNETARMVADRVDSMIHNDLMIDIETIRTRI